MPSLSLRIAAVLSTPDRLLWAVRVRWLAIVGFLGLSLAAWGLGLFPTVLPVIQVAIVGGTLNALNGWCVRHQRYVVAVSAVAIPMDHVFSTYLVVATGGMQSPFLMLYIVSVLATAMLVDTAVAAVSALLAIGLWVAGISLQGAGYLPSAPLLRDPTAPTAGALYHGIWAAFFCYCLTLLVYLGGYISERLRESERDLAEKNRRLHDALDSAEAAHAELRAAYERLQQAEVHLIQSEKMRGLGVLVAGVAHELNNPISFVSANVEHVRSYVERLRTLLDAYTALPLADAARAPLDAPRAELRIDRVLADLPGVLADCEEGARRTKQIVSELRTFSRSDDADAWQRVDLHRGIDGTLGLLAHRLRDRVTVHRNFGVLPPVECLPGQLNQVFLNLLANAAEAIGPRPGNVWLTTRPGPAAGVVSIAVRDDGPGMSPEVRARIFEPFFTTKPVGQGTGLGLSVSYGIVQRHRGTLTVDSSPGQGATFTITLPVDRE